MEVQLPFLQVCNPDLTFVPIALGTGQFEILEALGLAIAEVLTQLGEPVLIIASSDMNHYENDRITRVKDDKAIDQILGSESTRIIRCSDERTRSACADSGHRWQC